MIKAKIFNRCVITGLSAIISVSVTPGFTQSAPDAQQNSNLGFSKQARASYLDHLQKRIKHAWFPPKGYEAERVKVIFRVHKDGNISNLRVVNSSGLQKTDAAALKAIENAAPFRPLPEGFPNQLEVGFAFDYSFFKNGDGGKRCFGTLNRTF